MMKGCLEIVSYQLKQHVSFNEFEKHAVKLQEMLSEVEGFMKREVFRSKDNAHWVELVEWASPEAAKRAEDMLMQQSCMQEAMELIDATTIRMHVMEQVL